MPDTTLTVKELRRSAGLTQRALSQRFGIPRRTVECWEATGPSHRDPPEYVIRMMAELIGHDAGAARRPEK